MTEAERILTKLTQQAAAEEPAGAREPDPAASPTSSRCTHEAVRHRKQRPERG